MEALAIVFIALGLAGGVLVLFHGMRLLPEVMLATRLAWAFTAVLFPIAGVLYQPSLIRLSTGLSVATNGS
jgi:hypothetical protein